LWICPNSTEEKGANENEAEQKQKEHRYGIRDIRWFIHIYANICFGVGHELPKRGVTDDLSITHIAIFFEENDFGGVWFKYDFLKFTRLEFSNELRVRVTFGVFRRTHVYRRGF
jgi:hypothetical protein